MDLFLPIWQLIDKTQIYPANTNYILLNVYFVLLVLQNKAITVRVRNLSDTVVGLESFIGSERESNPLYKDYHGELICLHIQEIAMVPKVYMEFWSPVPFLCLNYAVACVHGIYYCALSDHSFT